MLTAFLASVCFQVGWVDAVYWLDGGSQEYAGTLVALAKCQKSDAKTFLSDLGQDHH